MLGDSGTTILISPCKISGDQVIDSRGVEVLRSRFNHDHKRTQGVCVFVDLEPESDWPHFCRWIWIDDHGRTTQLDSLWPPSDDMVMVRADTDPSPDGS